MTERVRLSITLSVENAEHGLCRGRIGLVVYDKDLRDIVGLTAPQVAGRTGNVTFNDTVVARPSDNWFPTVTSNPRAAEAMLTTLFVSDGVEIEESQPTILSEEGGAPRIVRNLIDILGEVVLVHLGPETTRKAYVRSTDGQFRMRCPWTKEMTLFNCAVEIATLDDRPITNDGDAGALVTTMSGDAIGLVVCGFDDVSFVAPFATKDSLQSCRLLTRSYVQKRNRRVADQSDVPLVSEPEPAPDPAEAQQVAKFRVLVESEDKDAFPPPELCLAVGISLLGQPSETAER